MDSRNDNGRHRRSYGAGGRCLLVQGLARRALRGTGGALITLLGEPACEVMYCTGEGRIGPISSSSDDLFVTAGADRFLQMCRHDLDRLYSGGYVSRTEEGGYRLAGLLAHLG